jgi:hypothetical protein
MPRRTTRFSFLAKLLATITLVAAADRLFHDIDIGSWIGGLALGWALVLLLARPALRRRGSLVAIGVASGFAASLAYDPSLLGWALFWGALSIGTLMPRVGRFDDAWRWALRLTAHALSGPLTPIFDFLRLSRMRPRRGQASLAGLALLLGVPVGMTALFLALFASANPLIANALTQIRLPWPGQLIFWVFTALIVWPSLRPSRWATRATTWMPRTEVVMPNLPAATLLLSLLLFNAVFGLQNGLDLAFLWSGAPLPRGVTLADYAHRGAYPLIATALLAGLFVLVALKPGSPSAANPVIRRLVVLWVAQNLLLVASSILRTFDYIEAYSLTALRIAALAWMALVAIGLALICWRMLANKSAAWLINTNALMAVLMLSAASVIDLDASAAAWNARHAREVSGRGVALDLCYLSMSGSSSLLSLVELERQPLSPAFRDRVRYVRDLKLGQLSDSQANWRSWTWRGARRLATAQRLLGPNPAMPSPAPTGSLRNCDGSFYRVPTPTPAPPPTVAPDSTGDAVANAVATTTPPLTGTPTR